MPYKEKLIVPESKVLEYLLNCEHPVGKHKARFFRSCGFSPDKWIVLKEAIQWHAESNPVTAVETTRFGVKYIVDGSLPTPGGGLVQVRVIWFLETDTDQTRLVTAYPLPKPHGIPDGRSNGNERV